MSHSVTGVPPRSGSSLAAAAHGALKPAMVCRSFLAACVVVAACDRDRDDDDVGVVIDTGESKLDDN